MERSEQMQKFTKFRIQNQGKMCQSMFKMEKSFNSWIQIYSMEGTLSVWMPNKRRVAIIRVGLKFKSK